MTNIKATALVAAIAASVALSGQAHAAAQFDIVPQAAVAVVDADSDSNIVNANFKFKKFKKFHGKKKFSSFGKKKFFFKY